MPFIILIRTGQTFPRIPAKQKNTQLLRTGIEFIFLMKDENKTVLKFEADEEGSEW